MERAYTRHHVSLAGPQAARLFVQFGCFRWLWYNRFAGRQSCQGGGTVDVCGEILCRESFGVMPFQSGDHGGIEGPLGAYL